MRRYTVAGYIITLVLMPLWWLLRWALDVPHEAYYTVYSVLATAYILCAVLVIFESRLRRKRSRRVRGTMFGITMLVGPAVIILFAVLVPSP